MADYNIENLNFLVVDDDANMRHLVYTILSSLGVRNTETAGSGERALAMMDDFDPDMVICDLRMAPQDGIAFTRMLRNDDESPNRYVPIIMLTGHAEKQTVEAARDAGVHEFLAKPVSARKLYEKIRAIIDNPRQFIRTGEYFGPDRRRRQDPQFDGPDRRKKEQS